MAANEDEKTKCQTKNPSKLMGSKFATNKIIFKFKHV